MKEKNYKKRDKEWSSSEGRKLVIVARPHIEVAIWVKSLLEKNGSTEKWQNSKGEKLEEMFQER